MNFDTNKTNSVFPSVHADYVYNFAYGSNMFPRILSGRRKIHPIESIPGVLEGWQLTFDLSGVPGVEPCFGNIKENVDAEIHGVSHKISGNDFKRLLESENGSGVDPNGYIPYRVHVHAYDGRIIEAYALVVRQNSPRILCHHAIPSARYVNLLRQGAIHHKIHPLYIEYLQSLPSIERTKPILVLVIIEILFIIILFAPFWIPVIVYYLCTEQKAHARAFFFTLIVVNLWRIYHFFRANQTFQPYYSAPFPIGSTNFKENTKHFRTQVQIDEEKLEKTLTNDNQSTIIKRQRND